MKQVGDKKDRNGDTTYCYTDAGLTGNETTCKDQADNYCEKIGLERPSKPYRDCRSTCLGSCMEGKDCTFAAEVQNWINQQKDMNLDMSHDNQ